MFLREFRQRSSEGRQHHGRPGVDGIRSDGRSRHPGTGTGRDGYADSFEEVAYNNPGSAFIQSNTWDEISGKTVGTSHLMSDSYVASRNIADYTYMFRCQEYQGYLACGTGNTGRGHFSRPQPLKSIDGIRSVKVSFDFCYQYGSTDLLLFQVVNGGMIASASVDGKEHRPDGRQFRATRAPRGDTSSKRAT